MACIPRKDGDKSNKSSAYIIHPTKVVFTKQPLPAFHTKLISSSTYRGKQDHLLISGCGVPAP